MTKTEKTKHNQMLKEIEDLKKPVVSEKTSKDNYYKEIQELKREIDGVHLALDTLPGITGKTQKVGTYREVDLTISARLFAWISCMAFGGKSRIVKTEEE